MAGSRFNHENFGEYRSYLMQLGADNGSSHSILLKNLSRAIREELTDRQWELVKLYYIDRYGMPEIARMLGINISTVSRTIKRGRIRLYKCLRYGAKELLNPRDP